MFRLSFAISFVLLFWLQSFFAETVHTVSGTHHEFGYGFTAYAFFSSYIIVAVVFAAIALRVMKDKVMMWIALAVVPLMCVVVLPQLIYERVELTDTHLVHRREPPHEGYNCDIAIADVLSVIQTKRETGSFDTYFAVGYHITTVDGREYELPSCTVVTNAHNVIDAMLKARNIPIETRTIQRPPAN